MKIGDMVQHQDGMPPAAQRSPSVGSGLIIGKCSSVITTSDRFEVFKVFWSKELSVTDHYWFELRVTHEGG